MTNSEWNFGNGYFGTTAITSNSTIVSRYYANGQGKFQYHQQGAMRFVQKI